jgi:protein SCO1
MTPWRSASFTLVLLAAGVVAHSTPTLRAPGDLLSRVGFDQKLGTQVPQALTFRDTQGAPVRLHDEVGGRPTLLAIGYYRCTNLCDAVRSGIAQAVEKSGLAVGEQFNIVLVSIDPRDTPPQALVAQNHDTQAHPRAQVARWCYLTGADAATTLAEAVGFRYFFDPRNGQYAHTAGIVLLSPSGRVTQYLFGVQFAAQTLRLALVQAGQGRIGTIVDRLLLLCCDYDPSTGRYSLLISRLMQGLGVGTAVLLVMLIVTLRYRERHRQAGNAP